MNQMLPNSLDSLAQWWGSWMWSMSLHVSWLVVLLCLADFFLRRGSARLRFAVWLLVLVRLVVPPDLAAPTGIAWWLGDWFTLSPNLLSSEPLSPEPLSPDPASTPFVLSALMESTLVPRAISTSANASVDTGGLLDSGAWWRWFNATNLCMLWLGVVAAQLGLMIYGWIKVRSWLRQAEPITDPSLLATLQSAKQRVGLTLPIKLCDSGACTTPLVIGWRRPVILLPTAVRNCLSLAELETVLVHELMHVVRGDGWWRFLQACLSALYFFHPAVWLARHVLQCACEEACDEQTIHALAGQRRNYAGAILKAATMVGYQPPHLALNMLGDALPVKRRMQRILDPRLPWAGCGGRIRLAITCVLALLLLPSGVRQTQGTSPLQLPNVAQAESRLFPSSPEADSELTLEPSLAPAVETVEPVEAVEPFEGVVEIAQQPVEQSDELRALERLRSEDYEVRMAAYQELEKVGTLRSLSDLETAFLNRSGLEQDAAKLALDRVWQMIRQFPNQSSTSSRMVQSLEEN
ncbi:MAG: M56 family metallopeptidase [Pirellulaceae bacterium]|nr:M56 family metallopeptidase [Pirellulaceae bacterium]